MSSKSRGKELVKNTIIVAIGKICTQFISFFLLPLYTTLLSAEEYGIVDLVNTYIFLCLPLIFFQIDQAVFRNLIDVRKKEEEKKKIISTTVFAVIVQSVLFMIVYFIVSPFIHNEYKFFLLINVIATIFSNIFLQISRGCGDNATYSQGSLVSGATTIIFNVLFIAFLHYGASGMLFATFFGNILTILYVFFKKKLYRYISVKYFDLLELKSMWKYSLPLVPNQLSWWVINASDRTIVTIVLGVASNGIYSAANKFSSICITLFNIFNMTWTESASLHIKDGDSSEFFSNIFNITLRLFTCICFGIITLMPFVFNLFITGSGYSNAYYQILILMIGTIFNIIVSLIGGIYVAIKKSNEIAKTSIYSAIINIVINVLLIKYIGLFAASISTLFAYLLMAIYRYFDVQKYVRLKIDKKFMLNSLGMAFIIILSYYFRVKSICFVVLLLTIIYSYIGNVELLNNFLKIVKTKLKK